MSDCMNDYWALEEWRCATSAIEQIRMNYLSNLIDELAERLADCDQLIADGKVTHQHAYDTMVKPQVERIVEARNRVLSSTGLGLPPLPITQSKERK